jgi:Lon protease-like protein
LLEKLGCGSDNSSMHEWLPLFPLQVVLLPGAGLPLHIFEERYKEMIADVRRDRSEFGVVLAGKEGIAGTGCTAAIERVLREYPDGQIDILAVGRRRFNIGGINQDRSYLRCTAEYFDDDELSVASGIANDDPGVRAPKTRAIDGCNALRTLRRETPLSIPEMQLPQLSFLLARDVQDLDFRQQLLMARNEAERLRRLAEFFPGYIQSQQRVEHVKQVAPRNGHGHSNLIH